MGKKSKKNNTNAADAASKEAEENKKKLDTLIKILREEEDFPFSKLEPKAYESLQNHLTRFELWDLCKKHPKLINYIKIEPFLDEFYEFLMMNQNIIHIFTKEVISTLATKQSYDKTVKLLYVFQEKFSRKLTEEATTELRNRQNPYNKPIYNAGDSKYLAFSLTNLSKEYMKKFMMTGIIGFLYRLIDDHEFDYRHKLFAKFDEEQEKALQGEDDNEEEQESQSTNNETDQPDPENLIDNDQKRTIIKNFLDYYFEYNPDIHVRSAHVPCEEDSTRHASFETSGMPIPPADVFPRLNRYMDNNYEQIRQLTNDIYSEKPSVDSVIMPYGIFDTPQQIRDFKDKYEKEIPLEIKVAETNQFTFLEAWKENRDAIDISSRETAVLNQMIEESKKAERLAADMVRKRKQVQKKKEIVTQGADDIDFYKGGHAKGVAQDSYGADTAAKPRPKPKIKNSSSQSEQEKVIVPGPKELQRQKEELEQKQREQEIRNEMKKRREKNKESQGAQATIENSNSPASVESVASVAPIPETTPNFVMDVDPTGKDFIKDKYTRLNDLPKDQGDIPEDAIEVPVLSFKTDHEKKTTELVREKFFTKSEEQASALQYGGG